MSRNQIIPVEDPDPNAIKPPFDAMLASRLSSSTEDKSTSNSLELSDDNDPELVDTKSPVYLLPSSKPFTDITVQPGNLASVVDQAERVLSEMGKYFYQGNSIVAICIDENTGSAIVHSVTAKELTLSLSQHANWVRLSKDGGTSECDPPERHVNVLHDKRTYNYIQPLETISLQPFFGANGTLVTTQGYDKASRTFGHFDAEKYSIPASPTKNDALGALHLLKDLLAEFEFGSEFDQSAAISAMLTGAVRAGLPIAPMFHVRAHVWSSGKSYLCELLTAFATPLRGRPATFPTSDEECRKALLSTLMNSPATVEFDNLTCDLMGHNSLCTALTSEHMSGRVLGASKMATVSTRSLFLSSGNNVGPVQDMTRRTVVINLAPKSENPAERVFTKDLVPAVLADRERYVTAALTIVLAWINEGRVITDCPALASYNTWSDLCRQPLLWLGEQDPAQSTFTLMHDNPGKALVSQFIAQVSLEFGAHPFSVKQIVRLPSGAIHELLEEIASDDGESINNRKLGRWIKRHVGHISDGKRIISDGNTRPSKWRIQEVSTADSGQRW